MVAVTKACKLISGKLREGGMNSMKRILFWLGIVARSQSDRPSGLDDILPVMMWLVI